MHVLALDTATAATSVALCRLDPPDGDVATVTARRHVDPRSHAEVLTPLIREALAEAGVRVSDLAAIVAGTGPGPFTGLRVGLATAAAMGQALDLPTYGVCSLDGIATDPAAPADCLVATDARRREIYWAVYRAGVRQTEPAVDRPAQVRPLLATRGVRQAYGDGARRYRQVLGVEVADQPTYPDPGVLAVVARDRIAAGAPGEVLTPRYLRRPDAAELGAPKPVTGR